ncbi:hypothetical protein [Rhodoferax sp.]|uniref:c-type cytochrome n=1 Tax=Rhodoferax sp. TaxID=50421 RepID=UPI003434EDDF
MWAAFVSYPAYRSKTKSVSTFQQRLQSCFEYSMNGKAPPSGAPELVALESYAYWLATGAAVDPKLPGRGYSTLPAPAQGRDYTRGEQAWDVALYMNSHERPQDPRNSGSVRNTRATFHDTDESMYSRDVAGKVLGSTGAPQPFKPSKAPGR